jgi:hypothetical protein
LHSVGRLHGLAKFDQRAFRQLRLAKPIAHLRFVFQP